ncbi:right-handed parallel beta-helix repeat-containing protein [Bacteroides fragilis]|uniref:PDZ domain-containing protein n=1 Tax=Bacteroides fragilis TaxID=817 RepID=A0AB38PIE1_BACFG|nr:PDZ domain-containing protein [Bacteroides fragilis]KAB5388261.1 PDZ domain-containing protein [Bacteroides fragilis]TWV38503.1 PDZ domain-containing protein [Bacteroides fragilis]TWV45221.1 PDZ domain-containing protein [Bacteroides fragilis]
MKKLFFPLLLFVSGLLSAQTEITLYVSPSGSDHHPGTAEKPMATLEYAWKKASRQAGRRSITIYCEGTNYLSAPILITNETSGTPEHPIRFSSYPGQKAVISGSRILRNLRWKEYKNGIMQAKVEEELIPDQLFVNGKKQISARYPNFDPNIRIFNGYAADACSPERVKNWSNPAGGYLHAMHSREWGGYQYSIEGKDAKGELILEGGFQNNRQMGMHRTYRMVENIFEELDAEGEWYFDKETHTLYFYPPRELDLQTALFEVPQTETLFILKGKPGSPVRHVSVDHLELTQTLRTFMKTNEPLLRSDWKIYRGGALIIENAEKCSVNGCYLHDIGGNAIFFSNYNRNHRVSQNHITRIGASAVCFVGSLDAVRSPLFEYGKSQTWEQMDKGTGPLTPDYPSDCLVDDNLIHSIGEIEKQGAGIQLSMSARITIRNNSIYDLPRAGINVSEGTWGGHLIEGNDVFDTVLETGDHGSFNSWGRDRYWHPDRNVMDEFAKEHPQMVFRDATETTVIRNNRWRCDHGWDIDLDDGSSNYHIYNNLCLHRGLKLREGFARTVENNIMVNNTFHPHVWFANSQDIFRHNIVTTPYRPIQVKEWGKETDTNFFVTKQGLEQAQKRGTDLHSLYGDPLFIAPEKGDYRVKENSPALKTGFRNFDMEHFGVQCPHLKALAATPELPVFKIPEEKPETVQTYSWKGLTLKEVSTEGERSATGLDKIRGILVVQVEKGITALQANDVILRINGKPVDNRTDMETEIRKSPEGNKFRIIFFRNQKENAVTM